MNNIRRAIAGAALALPLSLGTAGMAAADDSFSHEDSHAGPHGSQSQSVNANTDGNGGSSYHESSTSAGPDGAHSHSVNTNADGDGNTSYEQNSNSAGADGAHSSNTSSSTGGNTDSAGSLSGVLADIGL